MTRAACLRGVSGSRLSDNGGEEAGGGWGGAPGLLDQLAAVCFGGRTPPTDRKNKYAIVVKVEYIY